MKKSQKSLFTIDLFGIIIGKIGYRYIHIILAKLAKKKFESILMILSFILLLKLPTFIIILLNFHPYFPIEQKCYVTKQSHFGS